MAFTAGSGMGTTITFGTSGWTGSIVRIGASTLSRDALDTTKINQSIGAGDATVKRTFAPGGAFDPGQFEVEALFTGAAQLQAITKMAETVTITFPTVFDTDTTLTGTGFILEAGTPECSIDDAMKFSFTVKWDGATGPTWS